MLKRYENKEMGNSDLGWLRSKFHFSFADYRNPFRINFGVLRVLNDDLVLPGTGFETHPHQDMEIISYVVKGELTHGDSMGNKNTIGRGDVQYMSAGTGVYHSEHNLGTETLRFLQIWIYPEEKGYEPKYGDYRFDWSLRKNEWLHMVSDQKGAAPIKVNQDIQVYSLELEKGKEIDFSVEKGRQAYLVVIEGNSVINGYEVKERDALEVVEESLRIKAVETSHIIVLEMQKMQFR